MGTEGSQSAKYAFQIKEAAQYSCARIKELIEQFGPRAPGSKAEYDAQREMARELGEWSDSVEIEGFTVHRQAFMGFIPFTVLLGIVSGVLFWLNLPLSGFVAAVVAVVPLVGEFLMYRQMVDFLFPGHPSHNVIATRKPTGETKQRIIFVGHADSQYEWTLNYKLGGVGMKLVMIPAVVGLFAALFANLLKWILMSFTEVPTASGFFGTLFTVVGYAFLPLSLCVVGVLFFQNPFKSVPGAADNLSGCYTSMCVLREMERAGLRFESTEVVCILSGSEEAGLRGAKAYVKAHKQEMMDTPTICIGMDTFRDLEHMAVYNRDMSGTVRHDPEVCALVKQAAANHGFDLKYESVYIGSSDAAAFTQGGIRSTGFCAMDPTPPRYYHTRLDNWDILIPEALEAGIQIALETTLLYDLEAGL